MGVSAYVIVSQVRCLGREQRTVIASSKTLASRQVRRIARLLPKAASAQTISM